ncbi:unnamed protein product [Anisakis simplex]|uniref:T20D4.11-like domain-containing protein n=1 Tax=Anisakis simplex TaxID=6269 RepID=A0A3P6SSX9_ANISI|nr:unnamed protein product [Anisakis simplex]
MCLSQHLVTNFSHCISLQFTLPTYRYTKAELLELCDGYANLYLCTGYASMQLCRNDELVRFARDHLGYVCNPMNLERFMQHFDCLRKVEEHNSDSCQYFIEGIAEPGKDQRKCRGVKQYNDCLQPKIRKECGKEAWNEFDKVIEWVGCRV